MLQREEIKKVAQDVLRRVAKGGILSGVYFWVHSLPTVLDREASKRS